MKTNQSITLDGKKIEYTLTKTNRKTIGISVGIEIGVKVAAPKRATKQQIEEVILKNAKWILDKLKALEGKKHTQLEFKVGETFAYLGKEYIIEIIPREGRKDYVELEDKEDKVLKIYLQTNTEENIKRCLLNWYRLEANEILKKRLKILSEKTGLHPQSVMIKDQKSRFGSCSSKRNINLNWKLVMAPLEIIDYVILHELCHLKEMNHSKDFWSLVESFMEDYKERRKWLKEKGGFIRLI